MKKIITVLRNNVDIALFISAVCIKALIYGKQVGGQYFSYKNILSPTAASILIIASFFMLLKRGSRKKLIFFTNLLISLILICDLNYFRYFKDIPSLSVIRNGLQLGPVKSSLSSLFKISDLLYFFDLILFIFIRRSSEKEKQDFPGIKSRFVASFCTFSIAIAVNSLFVYKLSVEQPRLLETMFNRVYIASELGILNAHGVDVFNQAANSLSRFKTISSDRKESIKGFLEANSANTGPKLKGEAKDKNLIVIQVEALQQFVIDKKIGDQEITPELNNLIKKSAYFNNFFYQVSSGGTSDAEFLTNNSLYPAPSGAAYYLYSGNNYKSLPNLLKEKGYATAAFHGYKSTFWNRNVMYNSVGFDSFYNERDFDLTYKVGLGLSDKSFFEQSVEKLKQLNSPYYAFFITLSSHYPFDDTDGYGEFPVGDYENTLIGNYLKAIHYTDEALGSFINRLESEGILDNSIVVIYGDHSAIPEDSKDDLAKFMSIESMNELEWAKLQKVPMLIHFPQDKNIGVYENYGGQIDLSPTLDNLFLLENQASLGKDLFNTKGETVIFRNSSFTDGNVYYSAPTSTYYKLDTSGVVKEDENLRAKKEDVLLQLEYSDEILKFDLLKKYNSSND